MVSRALAYRRLAIAILGLDVATLAGEMLDARRVRSTAWAGGTRLDNKSVVQGRPTVLRVRSRSLDDIGVLDAADAVRRVRARVTVPAA